VDGQVWGEQAEHLAESLQKGDRVLVIGRWVTRVFNAHERLLRDTTHHAKC
jgi:single-stranded DNA-binding protein